MVVWDPDGAGPLPPLLVVGGDFHVAGDLRSPGVVAWDGTTWQPLGGGVNGHVFALTVWNGDLIAGGTFSTAGGVPAANIARWNGMVWQPLGSGTDADVLALAVYNGDLIAGGGFFTAGGNVVNGIARWNGSSWTGLAGGVKNWSATGSINALAVFNGDLVVAGLMTWAGGVAVSQIARWNGTTWQSLPGTTGSIRTLTTDGTTLVAAGSFVNIGGITAYSVARWNGVAWQAFPFGSGASIHTAIFHNGELYIGGDFYPIAGQVVGNRIQRLDAATSTWQPLGGGLGTPTSTSNNQAVTALASYGGDLFANGIFSVASGIPASCIARWSGGSWHAFPGEINGSVSAMVEYAGDPVAGGALTVGTTPTAVGRWRSNGWQPIGTSFANTTSSYAGIVAVWALTVYNGDLIAGGVFNQADGGPANYIARWNGMTWVPLGGGLNSAVIALTVFNGDLIAAGGFTTAGGTPVGHVARWNGTTWLPFGSITDTVGSLTSWNGALIAGVINLSPGNPSVLQWNGSVWQGIGWSDVGVTSVGTFNNDLIVGGPFTSIGPAGSVAVQASRVARFDGTNWSPLGSGLGFAGASIIWPSVSLSVFQGELIVGSGCTTAGGVVAPGLAAWNGASWHGFLSGIDNVGTGAFDYSVKALLPYHGALLAGGGFLSAGGLGSASVIRWSTPLPTVLLSQPAGPGAGVQIENRWLLPGHQYFNLFDIDICSGGPGTGPYGGLCCSTSSSFNLLVQQALLPNGVIPFHYTAGASSATFGPYPAPIGLTFDVLCIDSLNLQAATTGCLSAVTRWTVQ